MLYPDLARGYVDDFLRMCFAVPYERFDSDPLYVHALGRLLIIHADHEQNCSTSVVRIAGSAHANLYAAISAGINALSGPLHGGANEAVLRQLKRSATPASPSASSWRTRRPRGIASQAWGIACTSRMIRVPRSRACIWRRSSRVRTPASFPPTSAPVRRRG